MTDSEMLDILDSCTEDVKLAVTAWVFAHLIDHAREGGSFRLLIYERLGFSPDAYTTLYLAGGETISNNYNLKDGGEMNDGKHTPTLQLLAQIAACFVVSVVLICAAYGVFRILEGL